MEIFSKEDAVQQLLHDVENLMEDLYQSGFDTVHDSTLEAIKNMQKQTAAYGMQLLSDMLLQLADGLTRRRHQIKKEEDSLINLYTDVYQYMYLCKFPPVSKRWVRPRSESLLFAANSCPLKPGVEACEIQVFTERNTHRS